MSSNSLNKQERKIVSLAALGGMLEFYDFVIYGIFSVYFAHQFFPNNNPFIVILQSYLIFILGYIARPIGGIIFSHIGDEYGRKTVLILTIVLMGLASLGIGLLPTYTQIGISAPLLLLVFRLIQGLAIGGELPSTYVYISESISDKQGIAFGITMSGVNAGLLLGMFINYLLNQVLSHEQLESFGWRIPFIFGGIICLVSYQIRKSLQETAVFKKEADRPKLPILYLLRHHFLNFLAGTGLIALMSGFVVVIIVFMPTYLHEMLKIKHIEISHAMTFLMLINVLSIYLSGRVCQYFSPVLLLKGLLLLSCLLVPGAYLLISSSYLKTGLMLLGALQGVSAMLSPLLMTRIFEAKIRLSGVALCYNVGFTLFGGLAPLILTRLIQQGTNIYWTPCCYLLTMILICSLSLYFLRSNKDNNLN